MDPRKPLRTRPTGSLVVRSVLIAALVAGALALVAPEHTLDAQLYYTVDHPLALLRELGERGRESYLVTALTDLCFVAAYTRAAWMVWRWLGSHDDGVTRLPKTVMAPACFDLIETVGIIAMLIVFPEHPIGLAVFVTVATPCKWAAWLFLLSALAVKFKARTRTN